MPAPMNYQIIRIRLSQLAIYDIREVIASLIFTPMGLPGWKRGHKSLIKKAPFLVAEKGISGHGIMDRRTIFRTSTIVFFSIVLLLYGIRIIRENVGIPAPIERSETMFLTKQNSLEKHGIPPDDVSYRAKTQTATFALG